MSLIKKILKEYSEDILNQHLKNPKTGRNIKVSSALEYDASEPVEQAAEKLVQKLSSGPGTEPDKAIKGVEAKKNERSHKPKSASYGISKECVEFLKSKGFKGLNAYPQSFVKISDITFNPALNKTASDKTWVCKFPIINKDGSQGYKTAYTSGFMKKSQVKKYKKISKIKEDDIVNLETKTSKLLMSKEREVSDSACILKIILKTGLRIGSLDEEDSSTGNLGVRTLKKANIHIEGGKAHLKFVGKSYQDNIATIDDADVVAYLTKTMQGKTDEDRLFTPSYGQVGQIMKKINPKGINPKDLRTYKATQFAKDLLADKKIGPPPPLPKDKKQIKKVVKEKLKLVFDQVSKILNNSPAMARNSYIHPVIITNFLDRLGLTPKEVGYKHVTLESKIIEESLLEDDDMEMPIEQQDDALPEQSMDDLFAQYPDYGAGVETEDISDEDSDDCEEYPLPVWFYSDAWDLVPKDEVGINESVTGTFSIMRKRVLGKRITGYFGEPKVSTGIVKDVKSEPTDMIDGGNIPLKNFRFIVQKPDKADYVVSVLSSSSGSAEKLFLRRISAN